MKKIFVIGSLLGALVIAFGAVGLVYAQTQTPTNPGTPNGGGRGMMGGRFGGFNASAADGTYGPLHEYMVNALSKAFDLTPQELEDLHSQGTTLYQYAVNNGTSAEQFREKLLAARSEAFQQAAADGVISQDQADWMLSRTNGMWANGYGPGSGACDGTGPQGGGMRGGGFRWNAQPGQ
jgi:hypothetical protein